MKYNFIKSVAVALAISSTLVGCINSDDYSVPNLACVEPAVTVNKTVAETKAASTTVYRQYTADDVIEGYVTSSDERGNFFKTIYLQTKPTDGTAPIGFAVSIDKTTLFGANFYPGRKVYVKLKDLYFMRQNSILAIGDQYTTNGLDPLDPDSVLAFGRIPEYKYARYIQPSCDEVDEEQLVRYLTLTQALNDNNLGTLIELKDVQFADAEVGQTYYQVGISATAGGATNRYIVDVAGATVAVRTSSYANFSGNRISGKSGNIRGVLTKYGSDYQFVVREESDIKLTNDVRIDPAPPIVGTNLVHGAFNETFESYAVVTSGASTFPNAINDAAVGNSYWQVRSFSANKYLQFSSYNNTSASNRVLYIVPANFTNFGKLSFQTKDGYSNGSVLKVYYTTDYTAGGDINDATLREITSNFAISSGTTTGYATNFTNSGVYTIPATGDGFVVFEYTGANSGINSTMQIDNVRLTN
nr:DUF5689 domain-containing protein [uncultured Flavobacterium sp.]